jgi:hypothetical protein
LQERLKEADKHEPMRTDQREVGGGAAYCLVSHDVLAVIGVIGVSGVIGHMCARRREVRS